MKDRQKAIQKADKWFSLYIKARDGNRCIICGLIGEDCSHYISRSKLATRWDEGNAHAMCRKCHTEYHNGSPAYKRAMVNLYGLDVVEYLLLRSNKVVKLSVDEIKEIATRYKNNYIEILR